jgi:putative (di)nucleoside polyphosphate hydrolase
LVLVLERADHPAAWQLPQGGIEQEEDPHEALWRELFEEAGLTSDDVELVHEVPEWLGYELPKNSQSAKTGRGQVHKWFVLRARNAGELQIRLDTTNTPEFTGWRWADMSDVVESAVSFRRPVYAHLRTVLSDFERPDHN